MDIKLLQLHRALCEIPQSVYPRLMKLRFLQSGMQEDADSALMTEPVSPGPCTELCVSPAFDQEALAVCAAVLCCMEESSGALPAGMVRIWLKEAVIENAVRFVLTDALPLGSIRISYPESADHRLLDQLCDASGSVGSVSVEPCCSGTTEVRIGMREDREQRSLPLIAMEHCADLIRNLFAIRHSV